MSLKTTGHTSHEEVSYDSSNLADPLAAEPEDLDAFDDFEADARTESQHQSKSSTTATVIKALPLGISLLTLLYLFHLGGQVASIRKGDNQVLVQTVDGRSILAEPVDNYVRTPATVEQTVKQWTNLTFNWVQKLPNGEPDPGHPMNGKAFPTRLVYGSSLMSHEIQQVWYQVFQEREDYLPPNFLGSDATRVFFPKLQTTPRPPVDPRTGKPIQDRYEVEVHGDWVEYSSRTPQGKLIDRLSLVLRLRPVGKTEKSLSEDADSLQQAAYELRANGLEIYDIQRIEHAY